MDDADLWFRAVLAKDSRRVMSLVDRWARSRTAEGETALMLAVRNRSQDMVHALIPHEAGLLTPSGETSLAIAVQIDAPELCELLVREEGGIALPNGSTPLRLAMDLNHIDCVKALAIYYDAGRDEHGLTHLDYAVLDKNTAIVEILCTTGYYSVEAIAEALDLARKDDSPAVVEGLERWLSTNSHLLTPKSGFPLSSRLSPYPVMSDTSYSIAPTNTSSTSPPTLQTRLVPKRISQETVSKPARARPSSAFASQGVRPTTLVPSSLAQVLAQSRAMSYNYKKQICKLEEHTAQLTKRVAESEERNAFLELFCIKQQKYITALSKELHIFREAVYNITSERIEYLYEHPAHKAKDSEYVLGPRAQGLRSPNSDEAPNVKLSQGSIASATIRRLLSTIDESKRTETPQQLSIDLKRLYNHISKTIRYDGDVLSELSADMNTYIKKFNIPRNDLRMAFLDASCGTPKKSKYCSKEHQLQSFAIKSAVNKGAVPQVKSPMNRSTIRGRELKGLPINYEKYRLYSDAAYRQIGSGPFSIPESPSIKGSRVRCTSLPTSPVRRPVITDDELFYMYTPKHFEVLSEPSGPQEHDMHYSNGWNKDESVPLLRTPEASVSSLYQPSISPSVDVTNTMTASTVAQLDVIAYYIVDHIPTPEQYLLKKDDIQSELMLAAHENDLQGCLKHFRDQSGRCTLKGVTALMIAAERGYADCVRVLRRTEAGHQISDPHYATAPSTALMFAALNGHLDCARLLLETDEKITDDRGWTALMCATCSGNRSMIALLLPSQAGYVTTDHFVFGEGFGALSVAILLDNIDTVTILMQNEKERESLSLCQYRAIDLARSKAMRTHLQSFS
ncbi:Protein 21.1 [Giardia lamblia P15]|uniref:Protein 21.1 n=1 Tax=Giardia intestinalis (strain P15) TaxID=658858 RepID=E1EZD8_GIAIA|nr:Protein 21.1 [Giardia lamblia P15]